MHRFGLGPTLMACLLPLAHAMPQTSSSEACAQPGQWLIPPVSAEAPQPAPTPAIELMERLAGKDVVLLGENHPRADDHRWQLEMLTALHQRHPDMAIGFEMFPRRLQGVLDRWVAGQFSEEQFLEQAEWKKVWGFDARLYLPLFRFAREHKLPMLALNVERGLVKEISESGWSAIPEARREGVGQPAEPTAHYRTALKFVFEQHPKPKDGTPDEATRFNRFVEAQILWDRAMAEGIASYRRDHPGTLVVGILGSGHLRHGHGVPHQLQALGQERVANLVTLPSDHVCTQLSPNLADAVFVIPPQPDIPPPPRLGVSLKPVAEGVQIEKVWPDTLAEKTGLKDGDVILQAAGSKVGTIEDVRGHVQRQPPGTWLPLLIRRGGASQEIVVRFPPKPEPTKSEPTTPAQP